MVVLSASVLTKSGKPLLSRQYVEISRIRIEGLLAAYPKLVGTGSQHHTFIETDSVRYLYQSIDTLILLLITNKASLAALLLPQSNILEDLETLRMLSKVVPDVAGHDLMLDKAMTEEKINNSVFELIFAFDEVISVGGHREDINMEQLKTYLEMDSHEERIHKMVQETKLEAAKDVSIRRAKELKERQKAMGNMSRMTGISGGGGLDVGIGSMGNSEVGGGSWGGASQQQQLGQDYVLSPSSHTSPSSDSSAQARSNIGGIAKGMKLGGGQAGKKKESTLDALMAEDKLAHLPATSLADGKASSATTQEASRGDDVPTHPVTLHMEEKLSVQLSREGTLEQLELRGVLSLTSNEEDSSKCKVSIGGRDNSNNVVFQMHPKVNKQMYEKDGVIILKDASKGFPIHRSVGILRWSTSGTDESLLPLSVNCWPEDVGEGMMNVNIEYSLLRTMELHNLRINIPLGGSSSPQVESVDGSHRFDASSNTLVWSQDIVDQSNASGSLEFNVPGGDPDAFFPLVIQFDSRELYAGITVLEVSSTDGTDRKIEYGESSILCTDNYVCQ